MARLRRDFRVCRRWRIMALFTSIFDTARYSIAAKLSGAGALLPFPSLPIVRATLPRKTASPGLPVIINQAFLRPDAFAVDRPEPRNPVVAIFTAGRPARR